MDPEVPTERDTDQDSWVFAQNCYQCLMSDESSG